MWRFPYFHAEEFTESGLGFRKIKPGHRVFWVHEPLSFLRSGDLATFSHGKRQCLTARNRKGESSAGDATWNKNPTSPRCSAELLPRLLRNVTALYNGWSSNGDLVLSTSFGAQDTFLVRDVPIEGLKEALQLMVEGLQKTTCPPVVRCFGNESADTCSTGRALEIYIFCKSASGNLNGFTRLHLWIFLATHVPKNCSSNRNAFAAGETRRFWIPGKLGFGATSEESRGLPPGPGFQMTKLQSTTHSFTGAIDILTNLSIFFQNLSGLLVFDLRLMSINS